MHPNKANGSAKNGPHDPSLKTTGKQRSLANLRPFKKGQSGNPGGRPKSFDEVRAIAQEIANETESNRRTAIENVLRRWKHSIEPSLQRAFVEYAFGKVPDKLETTLDDKRTLKLHWPHERQDLEHANGSTGRSN